MSTTIEFKWDSQDLAVWRSRKVDAAIANALSKAGSNAARAMKAEANRKVRDRKRVRVSAVNKALPITFPSSKEISRLAWKMDVSGALFPVFAFPHRQTRKGVSVEINRGKRVLIKSAFLATMKSGHSGVFLRKGKGALPIKEAWTTKISDVFLDGGFVPEVQTKTQEVFSDAFARLLPLEMGKVKP